MSRKLLLFALVALVAAAVCTRLGFWQLDRLSARRARNVIVARRLEADPVSVTELPRDTAELRYRRATVRGRYDFAREIVLTSRARNGSPGVNLVTPMRVEGWDTLVLVNRGWVYSPDGASVRVEDWREPDTATVAGYVEPLGAGRGSGAIVGRPTALRWLERAEVERRVGAPVAPFVLVQTAGGAAPADTVPPRHTLPQLDEGTHLSYAVQWFSFAAIAIIGLGTWVVNERREMQAAHEG
jgi:surfeit locus 1 family protein